MELQIKNKIITAPIEDILKAVKSESNNGYLNYIGPLKGDDIAITCPFHKNGRELHPSCHVYANRNNPNIYYGTVHCFTCGKSVPLYTLVGKCFEQDDEFGKQWLIDNFGDVIISDDDILPEITLNKPTKEYLDKSILRDFNYFHPYLESRHLNKDVCQYFQVGFDKETNCVTFPVWDENNNLVGITRRSVEGKKFILEGNKDKPVYLLNFVKNLNINNVYVTESQINALTLWSWGYPAIALFGTGSKKQYDILNKSEVHSFCLALDGDDAGRKGVKNFIKNIHNDKLISVVIMPDFTDVNNLSKEQFLNLKCVDKFDYLKFYS